MKGESGFLETYSKIYGDRWPKLKEALLEDKKHVAIANPFKPSPEVPGKSLSYFPGGFLHESNERLENFYYLDAASILPIIALDPKPGEKVLDLCAAPGGKSLLISYLMKCEGSLISNDRSMDRRLRMKKMLEEYLGERTIGFNTIKGFDAQKWGLFEKNIYDKILLDAPCSSERHVLMDPKELQNWSIKRPKRLAQEQFSMLCAALEAVKPQGIIVYSTCSMFMDENDGVIKKLYEKRKDLFTLIKREFPFGEATEFGWRVLPDQDQWGPFYLSIIQKR